jgi:crossover junction endodeoxyribonuclease RuvC
MIVIGIDPGLAIVGYGVLERRDYRHVALAYECITTPGKEMNTPERLLHIYDRVCALLDQYRPSMLPWKNCFFQKILHRR